MCNIETKYLLYYLFSSVTITSAVKEYKIQVLKIFYNVSRDSAVGAATGYRLEVWGGGLSPARDEIFLLSMSTRLVLGSVQPHI
jgi:hypothetical protein